MPKLTRTTEIETQHQDAFSSICHLKPLNFKIEKFYI